MDVYSAIENRHSMRDFKADPVAREVVERLLHAASLAPSAMNEQPWEFYCCRGKSRSELGKIIAQTTVHLSEYMEMLGPKRYEDAVQWYSSLGNAPVLVAVACIKPADDFAALNRHVSVGCALQNFLLAATAEGLAACNITFSMWVKDEMAELLGVPQDMEVISVMAIGHPAEVPPALPEKRSDIAVWLD